MMNLREWADSQGIHPQTAYRWFRDDVLPVPARKDDGQGIASLVTRRVESSGGEHHEGERRHEEEQ